MRGVRAILRCEAKIAALAIDGVVETGGRDVRS